MQQRGWKRALLSWRAVVILVLWGGSLAGAGLAGALAYRHRADIRAFFRDVQGGQLLETNLYHLAVRKLSIPAEGRDGGIASLGDGILFANRHGEMWYIEPDLTLRELSLRVPINGDEFDADPHNENVTLREQFAVKDLAVQVLPSGVRLAVSYNYWHADEDCYGLRVSTLDTTADEVLAGSAEGWQDVFETTPCMPLTANPDGIHMNPTNGVGGRLAGFSDDELLLTVGGFGPQTPLAPDNSFGKTILIDVPKGTSRVFSWGHRNAQGLTVSSSGDIWLTEHGDRGGDELNLIREGHHYGFPFVSYGTEYESMEWSLNPHQGRHEGYDRPMYAWVPSIGVSQVLVIERDLFADWQGDILVSSLAARSLFRVRVEEDRTIFVEPIPIGHRIRDTAEAADGTLVLKADDNFLVYLRPIETDSEDFAALEPELRGQLLASGCIGCHAVRPEGDDAIGPSLWGVVGRQVAAREGYAYSGALRDLGGRWTADRLNEFLSNPTAFAPGTTMALTAGYSEQEIADVIAYLGTLE